MSQIKGYPKPFGVSVDLNPNLLLLTGNIFHLFSNHLVLLTLESTQTLIRSCYDHAQVDLSTNRIVVVTKTLGLKAAYNFLKKTGLSYLTIQKSP